jgi:hypothetical protein
MRTPHNSRKEYAYGENDLDKDITSPEISSREAALRRALAIVKECNNLKASPELVERYLKMEGGIFRFDFIGLCNHFRHPH